MATLTKKQKNHDCSSDMLQDSCNAVLVKRLENIFENIIDTAKSREILAPLEVLAKTDILYAIDMIIEYSTHNTLVSQSKEKKRLLRRAKSKAMFLERVEKDGGILSSAEVAKLLGKTKTTIRNWKNEGRLLALNINDEFYYPVFQFSDNTNISDKGILKGVPELLKYISAFSDRMQYSFFMEPRDTVLNGFIPPKESYTVIDVLKQNPNVELMDELYRLARLYNSQNLV